MHPIRITLLTLALLIAPVSATAKETPPAQPAAGAPAAEAGLQASAEAQALVDLLKNDAARAALIARLEEVAAEQPAAQPEVTAAGLMTGLAQRTAQAAERLAALVAAVTAAIVDVRVLFSSESDHVLSGSVAIAKDLAILAVITLGLFFLLRALAERIYRRLAARAGEVGPWRTLALLLASVAADAATAVVAWAAGHAPALWLGEAGELDVSQTLFLNAFLVVELIKVAMRAVLAPRYRELRLLPMDDETAAYWNFWASRLVSLLGYGLALAAPLVKLHVSVPAAEALAVLVALTAAVIVVIIVLQNRAAVAAVLDARAAREPGRVEAGLLRLLARTWHLAAILYVGMLFAEWVADPDKAAAWMLTSSLQTLVAIAIAALVSGFIGRWVAGGVHVPDDLRERLPLLESRLNAYVPLVLRLVRLGIIICVLLVLAHIWEVADVIAWTEQQAGREVLLRILSAFVITVVALAAYLGVSSWVEFRLNPNFGTVPTARERTLLALFRNAFTIALVIVAGMLVLAQLGVNIAPLLAGAGVLGLAIGFGAQKLVQDVITGAFIQLENAMNEGDVVTVGGVTGVVENLTIRSVGLRDLTGVYHVIPFSSADRVSNFMKGFSYHVAEIGVAYRENIAEVKELMHEAFARLKESEKGVDLIDDLDMHGVTQFADSAVMVRARLKCRPGTQWALGRAYNEILKELFDERGVEIPFPHLTLYMGEDKSGDAPPLRVRGEVSAPG